MEEQIVEFHGKFLRTGLFRNEHNVMFQEIYIINEESKHISKSYNLYFRLKNIIYSIVDRNSQILIFTTVYIKMSLFWKKKNIVIK